MHDVGMNMSQLAMSVKQVDNTIELARSWSHDLLHATETYDMERIWNAGGKNWTWRRGPLCSWRRDVRERRTLRERAGSDQPGTGRGGFPGSGT